MDTGHLVAWDADMNYKVTKASSSIMSRLTSGEMLVCRFTGPGALTAEEAVFYRRSDKFCKGC